MIVPIRFDNSAVHNAVPATQHNKQPNRFTLKGQKKVDAQWKLYCLVYNIKKLAHHGYAQ